ncbi:MAG: FUSC family protein [Cyanobacteria bacterium J06638_22]
MVISIGFGTRYFGSHGYWFSLTFVLLALPPHAQLFDHTLKRVMGTLVGAILVIVIGKFIDSTTVHILLATISQLFAVRLMPVSYVGATTLLTIGILEMVALSNQVSVDAIAFERLGAVGAAALLAIGLVVVGVLMFRIIAPEEWRSQKLG